tara:strand:+ start:142 stop:342 length:201 start_codon:yes stop_codon:yes gene_type:complete
MIIRQARRFLKKITSNIWIFSEDFRIKTPMKLKKKIEIRVYTIALFWDGNDLKYNDGCQDIYFFCG